MKNGNGNGNEHAGNARLKRSRRVFLLISLAVFLPLLIMVGLQYFWLVNLKRTSRFAHKDQLETYIRNIEKELKFGYWAPIDSFLTQRTASTFEEPAKYLEKYYRKRTLAYTSENDPKAKYKPVKGVRYLFHNAYAAEDRELYIFDVEQQRYVAGDDLPVEVRDMAWSTSLIGQVMAQKEMQVTSAMPREDYAIEGYPMVYVYVPDENGVLVGVMGLIFNLDYLWKEGVPEAVEAGLPSEEQVSLVIQDMAGNELFTYGCPDLSEEGPVVSTWFLHRMGGGEMILRGDPAYTEWAGNNFTFNVLLSLFLALALAGGMIFALRTASREIQLSEMKNDFVSNVSHELRTPLASIRVFGELLHLGRVSEPDKVRDYGELIDTESRRLTQLINNILDFSKIERGQKRYHLESTDIRDVLGRVLKVFEVRLQESDLTIRYSEPDEALPLVRLDPDGVSQAVFNLVDNGVKYGREGGHIDVSLVQDNDSLVISVRDYGIGIPQDELEKIFERFHRVSTGAVHDVKGSGLGLSIVEHVARAHGGEVSVESEVGKGSTFSLRLPLLHDAGEVVGEGRGPVS